MLCIKLSILNKSKYCGRQKKLKRNKNLLVNLKSSVPLLLFLIKRQHLDMESENINNATMKGFKHLATFAY